MTDPAALKLAQARIKLMVANQAAGKALVKVGFEPDPGCGHLRREGDTIRYDREIVLALPLADLVDVMQALAYRP